MKQTLRLSFRFKLLMSGSRVVTTVEQGDNCVGPSYMKSLIDKIYETAMFLALLDDKVHKIHVAVFETSTRSIALGYCF